MSLRYIAGFLSAFYNPLKVPDAPTGVSATGGDESADVSFTAPADVGGSAITAYYAVSNPGQITGTASASPVTVSGLSNGTSYTFTVWATNSYGPSPYSAASGSVTPALPQRGLIAGGLSTSNVIEYIEIQTLGNATDFGDLTVATYEASSVSNATRGIFAGGTSSSNVISYVTIASPSDSTDFGDLYTGNTRQMSQGSINNTTRGIFAGGYTTTTITAIQYLSFATTGNTTNFGTLNTNGYWNASFSSSTRGVIGGLGNYQYITIATTGNSTTFGSLATVSDGASGASNSTRGLVAQGYNGSFLSRIEYVTIASTGNGTYFGDCSTSSRGSSSMSNSTRVVINVGSGGYPYASNIMEYVTIATTGNTTDFGDLTVSLGERTACSSSNGGTQ